MAFPRLIARAAALALLAAAPPATAHEFWLDPVAYVVEVGQPIQAKLKNGDDFRGSTFPYRDELFTRFEVATEQGVSPVEGRRGDNPALNRIAETDGLNTVIYESAMSTVTWSNFETFAKFLKGKKLDWAIGAHEARGLPKDRIVESYYRYPKALLKVGSGEGRDRAYGLPFELVAEVNPYTPEAAEGVRVRLLYHGTPVPAADIQIFHHANGEENAVTDHVTTDTTGRALIPAYDRGAFLLNATMIAEPRAEGIAKGAMWESLWASMTYELPK